MNDAYELIIVGGGAMGLSGAYNAVTPYGDHPVLAGNQVLLLEQFDFFNQRGSTAGASRQFRVQYTQDYLASLAVAAETDWSLLQQQTVEPLVPRSGSLWFGDPSIPTQEGGIKPAMQTMDELGIPYTALNTTEIEDRYGFRALPSDYIGFIQPAGGIINIPATLRTLFNVAHDRGVDLRARQQVLNIAANGDEVVVTTSDGTYRARKLIITPGPFANEVLCHLGITLRLEIWDMVSAYFRKRTPNVNYPAWFAFQPQTAANSNLYYGFPEADWVHQGYIRVAPDYPFRIIREPQDRRQPNAADFDGTIEWVAKHMPGLDPEPEFKSTCLIALPNGGKELILDFAPGQKNIVIYTGGWAAKFIPLIGKICVQMALTGQTSYNIAPFSIGRPGSLLLP